MENHTGRELLENVSISDVSGSQFIMQRMDNTTQLLGTDLLQSHNGIVVDLGGGDFIPVNYTSEDLLAQDLTEEDRNLAAALVAVQFSHQQKQQQLQDSNAIIGSPLPSLVSSSSLGKTTGLSSNYLQIVESENLYKQNISKLIDAREFSDDTIYDRPDTINIIKEEDAEQGSVNQRDSDGENRSVVDVRTSKKTLPHKKRISRKLKKNVSSSRKLHKCSLCDQVFHNTEDFSQHRNICETTITPINAIPFTCQLCSTVFHDQLEFFQHLKSHYEPSGHLQIVNSDAIEALKLDAVQAKQQQHDLLSCYKCQKSFRKQESLENHLRIFHKVGSDTSSKVDFNEFSETEDLMEGIQVSTGGNGGEDDSKAWYREEELHATEEDLRELEAQEHVCQICKQQFESRAVLKDHSLICNGGGKEQTEKMPSQVSTQSGVKSKGDKKTNLYSCILCDKVFIYKNSLVYHMRGHTGTRPHHCDQCVKSFYSSSALKIHLRMHTGDKPYKCEYCGKDFRQWGDLKYHCISIHSDQRQYQCEYCGKDFARKYSLVLHRRIHTGEKNYSCEYCAKSFRASTYLKNHIRIHTGEKPYSCDICGKKFRVSSDMKRHMKTHSRKRGPARITNQNDESLVAKSEDNENSDQVIMDMQENSEEHLKEESEGVVQNIQYEQDPLDSVRDSTLYVMPILIT